MWGKSIEREGAAAATAPAKTTRLDEEGLRGHAKALAPTRSAVSAVGETMRFRGEIHSDEELYFDGEIEGTLEVSNRLTIGPNGKVKANVKAKDLVVKGRIEGNGEAVDRIVIRNGASIVGDIKTAGIVIDDGAFFKGGIDIIRTEIRPESASPPIAVKSQSAGA